MKEDMWRHESKQQGLGGSTRLTGERTATKEAMTAGDGPGTPEGAPLTQIVDQGTPGGGCPHTQTVGQETPEGAPHTQKVDQGTPKGFLASRWWIRGTPRRVSSHPDGGSGDPQGGVSSHPDGGSGDP